MSDLWASGHKFAFVWTVEAFLKVFLTGPSQRTVKSPSSRHPRNFFPNFFPPDRRWCLFPTTQTSAGQSLAELEKRAGKPFRFVDVTHSAQPAHGHNLQSMGIQTMLGRYEHTRARTEPGTNWSSSPESRPWWLSNPDVRIPGIE